MKRILFMAVCAAFAASHEARANGDLADVAIIDRDSGAELTPYFYRGEYWVAGKPGDRYSIEIRNRLGERVLAVASVDGVNVLSGETANWDQTGYVFGARERYQITGWRKSDAEVAAFTFTASPNSYAERTGRPANVGVIGVALFREQPPVSYSPPTISRPGISHLGRALGGVPMDSPPAASAPAPSAPAARESDSNFAGIVGGISASRPAPQAAAKLGTGHGEREVSYVNRTDFARLQTQPNEVIHIRYDSLDNLLAMGIVKRPRPQPPGVTPFPGSQGQYVPDPPG